jgi:hypothetical protein
MQYIRSLTAIIGTLIAVMRTLTAVIHALIAVIGTLIAIFHTLTAVIRTLNLACVPVHAVYPLLVPVAAAVGSAVLGVPARASGLRQ